MIWVVIWVASCKEEVAWVLSWYLWGLLLEGVVMIELWKLYVIGRHLFVIEGFQRG